MTIESDEEALARFEAATKAEGFPWSPLDPAKERKAYTVFFVYMRFNMDGRFVADQYFHAGDGRTPIDPSTDPSVANSLGFYTKDMALYARPSRASQFSYKRWGTQLEDMTFPSFYSYCVFFMDDLHWQFLLQKDGVPAVMFHDTKNGRAYDKHDKAFGMPQLLRPRMPIWRSADTDERQAVAMINRMRKSDDTELGPRESETYCFDFCMRVRYAGRATQGVSLIIDPTGTNLGPPGQP